MLGRRLAATTGHPLHDHLAPWDLGAVDGHDRHHHNVGGGQDLGGLVGLERHRVQCRGQWVAAVPQPPRRVEPDATSILLGVDHEHPAGADGQMDAPMAVKAPVADGLGGLDSWS